MPLADVSGSTEADVLVYLQTIRWPKGFVCPKCDWHCTPERAETRIRRYQTGAKAATPSFDTLPRARGRIICPGCGKHVSLTSGTMLEGAHLPLSKVFAAAGYFIKASGGISAAKLKREADLTNTLTTNKLIRKFHEALKPGPRDQLVGVVQVDEGVASLGSAKNAKEFRVVVAAEKVEGGEAGRVALLMSYEPSGIYWIPNSPQPIDPKAQIETRSGPVVDLLSTWGIKPTLIQAPGMGSPSLCAQIFDQVQIFLRKIHRGAIKAAQIQEYLNGFAFRWNHREHPDKATVELMRRLLQKRLQNPPRRRSKGKNTAPSLPPAH